jgi:hypothetical protein
LARLSHAGGDGRMGRMMENIGDGKDKKKIENRNRNRNRK